MADETNHEPNPGEKPVQVTEQPVRSGEQPTDGGQPPATNPSMTASELIASLSPEETAELADIAEDPEKVRQWVQAKQGGMQNKPPEPAPDTVAEGGQQTEDEERDEKGVDRIRTKGLDPTDSILLNKAVKLAGQEKIPLAEAMAKVGLAPAPAAPTQTPPTTAGEPPAGGKPEEPEASVPKSVEDIDGKIAELKAERVRMRTEEFNFDRADEIGDEIAEWQAKRQFAVKEFEQAKQAKQSFEQQEAQSVQKALAQFPEIQDEDSEAYIRYQGLLARAERKGDPVLRSPDWPLKLAEQACAKAAPAKPTPVPSKPPPASKPTGAVAQASASRSVPMTREEAARLAASMSDEEVAAALELASAAVSS